MYRTIADTKEAILSGKSVSAIVEDGLIKIDSHHHLNAFVEVFSASARIAALEIDKKINNS